MRILCLGGGGRTQVASASRWLIGAQLIAKAQTHAIGVVPPEMAFRPERVFQELEKRRFRIHEQVNSPPRDDV